MTRHLLARVLISLLLLISQQLALSHGYSHWASGRPLALAQIQAAESSDESQQKSLTPEHGCAICLAASHFASALGSPEFKFFVRDCAYAAAMLPATVAAGLLALHAYQPRGPPQA